MGQRIVAVMAVAIPAIICAQSPADRSEFEVASIVNKTGLNEAFDIHLQFAPVNSPDSTSPSIFTAVQEQLGLRLESGKGPVEVLVIDQVERPSEN